MSRMTLSQIQTGVQTRPIRMCIYGVDKIGKTTFAASAPSPVFINAEDGQGLLNIARFPTAETWDDIHDAIGALYHGEHEYQTLVIDSIDWAESLCLADVCHEHSLKGIEGLDFGKGYKFAREKFSRLFGALDALWLHRGMNILLIGHCHVKRFDDPETASYDRYMVKLDDINAAKCREWVDVLAFANHYTTVEVAETVGVKSKTKRSKGSQGNRSLYLERSAAHDAGNRYGLPSRIPLDWNAFADALQQAIYSTQQAA